MTPNFASRVLCPIPRPPPAILMLAQCCGHMSAMAMALIAGQQESRSLPVVCDDFPRSCYNSVAQVEEAAELRRSIEFSGFP